LPFRAKFNYEAGPDGEKRPYLWLVLEGPSGTPERVVGLIDSGADASILPSGYAALLGYSDDQLEEIEALQLQGTLTLLRAAVPLAAYVLGAPDRTFEIRPAFVGGSHVIWGRDFMHAYAVSLVESDQQFALFVR
jgi:hypothetical protein